MKIRTVDLIGPALDWAVRQARYPGSSKEYVQSRDNYSTCYNKGGPIIDEMIQQGLILRGGPAGSSDLSCAASLPRPNRFFFGPTALIAALRCYVASRLGDEVEVPDGL